MDLETKWTSFFLPLGNATMILSAAAAAEAGGEGAARSFLVVRIEGGFCRNGQFEARYDCIWDGFDPPLDAAACASNNALAKRFIESEMAAHNAFVLTVAYRSGH